MIVYPIPKFEKDVESISAEDCYFYGILLGCGCYNNTNEKGHIILNSLTKTGESEFCETYLRQKCVEYTTTFDNHVNRIEWKKNIVIPIRYSDVYDEQEQKHIANKWLHLPFEKSGQIIRGLINTYGSENKANIHFEHTSHKLVESIRYILLRMGIITKGYFYDNDDIDIYSIMIPKTGEIGRLLNVETLEINDIFIKHGNFVYTRIDSIYKKQYSGVLYDLQMKDVHSYTTHNGIIHNGGGRRNGSFAIYLEPWHADIEMFLQMRKNHGDEELKARDLFYALWIPDLFMERVKTNQQWTLMCPDECPGLADVYGDDFVQLYEKYEQEGKGRKTFDARQLWFQILDAQMETGTPYLLYKDACNKKSNQKNLGTIKSSNLCTEIVEYSDENETAVCNLASIALPTFVKDGKFNYNKLHSVTKIVTENLNRVIDVNYYPTEKTRRSNMRNRPIGLGVSGLADVFLKMNVPFHSEEAKTINSDIFETIYNAALEMSCELAAKYGPYETYEGSPVSQGILQFDMWGFQPSSGRYYWDGLKERIKKHGIRNSLLMAPTPTASTSQILGVNECIEPITSNIYNRRTMAGEFLLTNKYLMQELGALGLWNEKIKNNIIANNGSIQQIDVIPQEVRDKYKTVWEIPMRHLIDMAADRGVYICQSQSLNLWLEDPNYNTLTSMHFHSWSKGLKTGIYYLRRRARHQAQQFTIEPEKKERSGSQLDDDHDICEMCSA